MNTNELMAQTRYSQDVHMNTNELMAPTVTPWKYTRTQMN